MFKYINRELSWLMFNERVLLEAKNKNLSIKNRFLFLSIFCSNLDEFFMVRVSSLKDQINAKYSGYDISGMTAKEQIEKIDLRVKELLTLKNSIYNDLMNESKREGLEIVDINELPDKEKDRLRSYFISDIFPILTPMALDKSRPFPLILSKSIYIAVKLFMGGKKKFSILQVPNNIDRLVEVESSENLKKYVLVEDLIIFCVDYLYSGLEIDSISMFRITRNADLSISEDDAEDLLLGIEHSLKKRKWGEVIRLEIRSGYDEETMKFITKHLDFSSDLIYVEDFLDLTFASKINGPFLSEKFKPFNHIPKKIRYMHRKNLFDEVKKNDIFFHVPYDSFSHIEDFLDKASRDKKVLAIKMTLYRINANSRILAALMRAAESGKQVSVLVELMARFDEENNIAWARQLEKTGANVIYGVPDLKTHSKIFLVVRAEEDGIKRYTHLSTGNYNSITAKLYTDMSILTCREDIGSDASAFFNIISGYGSDSRMTSLITAPYSLRKNIYRLIDKEIEASRRKMKAEIKIKINSLIDKEMIDKLYEASSEGVKIKLLVRGICSLIPKVKGLSENISVKSIIGEFLEHERIYIFKNTSDRRVYLASADLMTRNLDRRIEIMFPVKDQKIADKIEGVFDLLWKDNVQSWKLNGKGKYEKVQKDENVIHAHEILKK